MTKEAIVETGKSAWRMEEGTSESWSRVMELIELAKKAETEWTPERREQIFRQVVAKAEEKDRERRRVRRAWAAGAGVVLLAGLVIRLVGIGGPPFFRGSPELAGKLGHRSTSAE